MLASLLCYILLAPYSWGLTSEENLTKIEILQRKCLRIMTFSDFRSHTNVLFIEHKILKVREIIKLQQLQLLYNFLDNSLLILKKCLN